MKLCFAALVLNFVLFLNELEASQPNNIMPGVDSSKKHEDKSETVQNFAPTHYLSPVMNHVEYIRGKRPVAQRSSIDLSQRELEKVVSVKIPHELFSEDSVSSRTNMNLHLDRADTRNLPEAPIIPQARDKASRYFRGQRAKLSTLHSQPLPSTANLEPSPYFINNQHMAGSAMSQQTRTNNENGATVAYFPGYHNQFSHMSGIPEHAFQAQDHVFTGIPKTENQWDGPPGFGPKN